MKLYILKQRAQLHKCSSVNLANLKNSAINLFDLSQQFLLVLQMIFEYRYEYFILSILIYNC